MKRLFVLLVLVVSATVFAAFAQPRTECGGPHGCEMGPCVGGDARVMGWAARHEMRPHRMMNRDEGVQTSVRGRVVGIEEGTRGSRGGGVVLKVEADSRVVPVHLGPAWRFGDVREQIQVNQRVEITGRRVMRAGQSVMLADQIKRDGEREMIAAEPSKRKRHMRMKQMMHDNVY